jgi:hypothetical protein
MEFNIISPDGFPFNMEPFKCSEKDYETELKKQFALIKQRYERQGYYSSNTERIPLDELQDHCTIQKF